MQPDLKGRGASTSVSVMSPVVDWVNVVMVGFTPLCGVGLAVRPEPSSTYGTLFPAGLCSEGQKYWVPVL